MEKKVEGLVELNGVEEVVNVLEVNEEYIEWMEEVMVESGVYCIEVGSRGEWENIELRNEYEEGEYEGMSEDGKYYEVNYNEEYGLYFVKVKVERK